MGSWVELGDEVVGVEGSEWVIEREWSMVIYYRMGVGRFMGGNGVGMERVEMEEELSNRVRVRKVYGC